ncbi:GGDEF domain-containing protein [uncultured Aquincola sp.]|uniref:GGDEF domain-containing protein n=1 Tax=uncultured Aquincola sp. TaxID=886556 RepID=UPI0032B202A7
MRWRALLPQALGLALLLAVAGAAPAAPAATAEAAPESHLAERLDALQRSGYEHPAQALAALEDMRQHPHDGESRRLLLHALGSVHAQAGNATQARAAAESLMTLAQDEPQLRAAASANLVRALVAENGGETAVAAALAQSALDVFEADCSPRRGNAHAVPPCDWRAAWQARQILQRRAVGQGLPATEAAQARAGLALAQGHHDARRQAANLATLAWLAEAGGDGEQARELISQARRLVQPLDDLAELARLTDVEARIADQRGDPRSGLHFHELAQQLASRANAPRLEGRLLTNLSDAYVRAGRPAAALVAAEKGLQIVRERNDLRAERVLINNAGLAKIGLGRLAEGKEDMNRLLRLWQDSGDTGRQVGTLTEFGEALAAAGDARSALELFHRERALSAELMRINRNVALKELQGRNEAQARQRDIELLERDNALKTAALANRALLQRFGWVLALAMVAATVAALLLYRRVRASHRELAASQVQLQALSELDPLTQLSNRRHLQAEMQRLAQPQGGFHGGLLLLDLDHFKRINDEAGHAAGDEVLVEVARRLRSTVAADDLVVRWGGEEFLVVLPGADEARTGWMAQQLLQAVAGQPVQAGGRALHVTASVGHGAFEPAPGGRPLRYEQALALVDEALYAAKQQGRHRAVGAAVGAAVSAAVALSLP